MSLSDSIAKAFAFAVLFEGGETEAKTKASVNKQRRGEQQADERKKQGRFRKPLANPELQQALFEAMSAVGAYPDVYIVIARPQTHQPKQAFIAQGGPLTAGLVGKTVFVAI